MIIQGEFNNIYNDKRYKVVIGESGTKYTIKDTTDINYNDLSICFSTEPVVISQDFSDTTKHVIQSSATVNIVTNMDLSPLFIGASNRDIPAKIYIKNGNSWDMLFDGYVEPIEFNQPFAYKWTDISIQCSDKLAVSQYIMFPEMGIDGSQYTSPYTIIAQICLKLGLNLNFSSQYEIIPQYVRTALQATKINPELFIGEDEDDWVNLQDTLEEIGKYYGIYFRQSGNSLYIFNWHDSNRSVVSMLKDEFTSDDTQQSLSEVYKQVKLTCDADAEDELLTGLFDNDQLYSPYINYQKYMTEILSEGEGKRAFNGFWDLVEGKTPDWDGAYTYDHYMWIKKNDMWDFGSGSYIDYMEANCKDGNDNYYDAHLVMKWLRDHPGKGMLVALGRTDKLSKTDNSPINSVSLTDYLLINVNGKADCDNFLGYENDMDTQLLNNQPICSITSDYSRNITPSDVGTTNYIVISGKMILNPFQQITGKTHIALIQYTEGYITEQQARSKYYYKYANSLWTFQDAVNRLNTSGRKAGNGWWHMTVPHQAHKDGVYYTHKFLKDNNRDLKNPDYQVFDGQGMIPFLQNDKNRELEFKYSSNRERRDDISKLPVIACELKIGDKYCVERLDLEDGEGTFEWLTEEDCPTWTDEYSDSVTADGKWKYFTIGIDPKIGDYIIGSQYDIANNITVEMNINAKGMAIPIKSTDNLTGSISFKIMGPINLTYDEVKKSHHGWAFWRHTHWSSKDKYILQYLSSIMIGDLKLKLTSDNAMINNVSDDGDIVYVSESDDRYTDTLDESTYICTALTATEAATMELKERISNSFVVIGNDNANFYGYDASAVDAKYKINNTDSYVKPEQIYVKDYYDEYKEPRTVITTSVRIISDELITDAQKVEFEFGFKSGKYVPIKFDANLYEDTYTMEAKNMQF